MGKYDLIAILGPTATGKTSFAAHLAAVMDGVVLSADSRQVYKRMDLGTGKDLADYVVEGKQVPYELIDMVDPGYKLNVFEYQQAFVKALNHTREIGKMPIVCGGSGMYMEAVLKGYKLISVPENPTLRASLENKTLEELSDILSSYKSLHNKTDVDTVKRAIRAIEIADYYLTHPDNPTEYPTINPLVVGVSVDRDLRRDLIEKRLHQRLNDGLLLEVTQLLQSGVDPEDLIYYGLEYKYVTMFLMGQITYEDMVQRLLVAIHQFAKRQMTWYRGMERRGFKILWLNGSAPMEDKIRKVLYWFSQE